MLVVLPPGAMSGTARLSVQTLKDNRVEGSETFIAKATSISGPNAGEISNPPPSAIVSIGDDPPRISIEGSTQANESDGRVFLTARRSGGDMTKGISAVLETSGLATRGEDYNVPGGVTFGPDAATAQIEVTLLDDTAADGPDGATGWSENAIIAIGDGGNGYIATGTPATIGIADDADWFYTNWALGKKSDGTPDRPDEMTTPLFYLGEKDTRAQPGYTSEPGAHGYVERYYYYDEWVLLEGSGSMSRNFINAENDVSFDQTIGYTRAITYSFSMTATVGGGAGNFSSTLFDVASTSESQNSKTEHFSGEAPENEKVYVQPLVKRRTLITYRDNYIYERNLDGSLSWNFQDTQRSHTSGYLANLVNQARFRFQRRWLDEDSSETATLSRSEPAVLDSIFSSLLPPPNDPSAGGGDF